MINEAIELAKSYGGTDGHKFVNGVLDKLAAALRAAEMDALRAAPAPPDQDAAAPDVRAGAWRVPPLRRGGDRRRGPRRGAIARHLLHATIPMPASSPRRRSRARPGLPSPWRASPPARCSRRSAPSATIRRPTSGTAGRSIRSCRGRRKVCSPPYRSPGLAELYPWAQRQAEATGDRVVAIYRIIIGFGTNPAVLAKKQPAAPRCWSDLAKPEYRSEIELSNPVTSGTGYTILATLVALYGEDAAFAYLKRLGPNVVRYTQSGTAQGPSVARGEVGVGVTFVHEFVTQQLAGFRGRHRDSLRGHRRRAGRHGDHRRRTESRETRARSTTGRSPRARRSSRTARAT